MRYVSLIRAAELCTCGLLTALGCGRTPADRPAAAAVPSQTPVAAISSNAAQSHGPPEAPLKLRAQTEWFERARSDQLRVRVVGVLRALAENARVLSGDLPAAPIRAAADRLASSRGTQPDDVRVIKDALTSAAGVLFARVDQGNTREGTDQEHAFTALVKALDTSASLESERASIAAALRATVNLTYLANNEQPPFRETTDQAQRARVLCDAVEHFRAQVSALADASQTDARKRATEALDALAQALSVWSSGGSDTKAIDAIKFQSAVLDRVQSFNGAKAIKLGLSHALDVMDDTFSDDRTKEWISASRTSVKAIDEGFVAFERAGIQDAFRSVADAFAAASRNAACCPP